MTEAAGTGRSGGRFPTACLALAALAGLILPAGETGLRAQSPEVRSAGSVPSIGSTTAPPAGASASTAEPLDPRAAKARIVLETHCARCHQRSMLRQPAPAGDLGDILDLDRIAADPGLVVAGNADASQIYTLMLRGRMPLDVASGSVKEQGPTANEIETVRDWIESLTPRPATCSGRNRVTPQSTARSIREVIAQEADAAGSLRFVTLAHLYNLCASEAEMRAWRQAVAKLVNSLSTAARPVRPQTIGEAGTLIKLRLADLALTTSQWEKLAGGNLLAPAAEQTLPEDLARRLGTAHGVLPGDWLAATATRPQPYYDVLGVPARLDVLLRSLGVDAGSKDGVRRIGVRSSGVTQANRLIEQRQHPAGSVWIAYDFAGSDGRRDIFTFPLGPHEQSGDVPPFKPDAMRVMWSLPNGFPAYAVYDAAGQRLSAVPAGIEHAQLQQSQASSPALGCISCHDTGPRRAFDELRDSMAAGSGMQPRAVRDAVEALHRPDAEMLQVFTADSRRFGEAMAAAGVDPDLRIDGIEIVAALAKAYVRPVTLARAAEDFGEEHAAFSRRLDAARGAAGLTAARLRQSTIPRLEAARLLATLAGQPEPPAGSQSAKPATAPSEADYDLALVSDKPSYTVGEVATFTVRSSFDCSLTLISINPAGKATVVFPNDFEPDNVLVAGKELRVPAESSPYRLRFNQAGTERMLATCMTQSKMADGIQQDYQRQRFTALGDWRNYLRAMLEDEAQEKRSAEKPEARAKGKATVAKSGEPERQRRIKLEPQARTAITIRVEMQR